LSRISSISQEYTGNPKHRHQRILIRSRSHALLFETGRAVASFFAKGSEGFSEGPGKGGIEARRGENPLGLAEGGPEDARKGAKGNEVLLEFGDPDREGLCSVVEGSEVLFELGGAVGEPGDLGEEVVS
jgi:hypothetical protein